MQHEHSTDIIPQVPETKQRTLEELDYIFAVPSRQFISYQTRRAAPWWFQRWVLFRKGAKLEPLYAMDRTIEGRNKGKNDIFDDKHERVNVA